jgi:hypothetical protein
VADSSGSVYDRITDFDAASDKFQLTFAVTGIDPAVTAANLAQLTHAFKALGAGHAEVGTAGGHSYIVIDANGVAGYQSGVDMIIRIDGAAHLDQLSTANFTS